VNINEAVREVIELTRGAEVKSCVRVRTQLAVGSPLIHGDRVQLQQVNQIHHVGIVVKVGLTVHRERQLR
jgi:hypothetical protein